MNQMFSDKILIVEDNIIYTSLLSEIVEPFFGLPIIISDGNDALDYLKNAESIPSMIILDYNLPKISGIEIIKALNKTNRNYPIIFLTAEGGTAIAVEAMKRGAIDFLEKGQFKLKDLPLIIKKNISIFMDKIEKVRLQNELEEHKNHLEELVQQRTLELEIHKNLLEDLVKIRTLELENTLSDLKATQVQLLQSEKMASLGILLAGVAHEINNPINYINSSLAGLRNVFEDILNYSREALTIKNNPEHPTIDLEKSVERIEKMLTNIKTGISKTMNIVNSLRTFSRNSDEVMREIDIHENIESTLTILYNQYKDRIEVKRIYGEIPLIHCYPEKVNQVLMNLLANAIQAIDKKGEIIITTKTIPGEDKVSISIQDTGMGIPESIQSKIFDPFFTTKDPGKGTGLGLSIAYDIIKQHNGEIQVQSTIGEGTKFIIILPIKGEVLYEKNITR
jgi:signal transduction histidine kinase